MKKLFRSALFLSLLLPLCASGQEPLITQGSMPNAVYFLPAPPDTASAAFAYDKAQYRWGLEQRKDSARCAVAVADAEWSVACMCRIYAEPLGFTISKEATPAIYEMLSVGVMTADQVGKLPKEHYMRTRPYVFFGEPTIVPGDEEELSHNGSYPSGHTILGWSAALLLTELAPEHADAILTIGYRYGQSRVIAGFHWQSDVDAGRLCASAAVARMHADTQFLELMKAAREEYLELNVELNKSHNKIEDK
ncbi:MAG: phosphatase PAP2 family protein [Bacteroidales bacterium]|nr:phosphatase PAP2 family protein [Bacteroidales bacterium]